MKLSAILQSRTSFVQLRNQATTFNLGNITISLRYHNQGKTKWPGTLDWQKTISPQFQNPDLFLKRMYILHNCILRSTQLQFLRIFVGFLKIFLLKTPQPKIPF